jgi:hypothetical protein
MRLTGNLKHTEIGTWVINHNNHDIQIHSKHNLWLIAHGKPGIELSFEIEGGVAVLKANSEWSKVSR